MRAPRGPARALTIQGARPESVRSPAGPRVSESRNGSPTHRGVCVRGSLCAGRGRVRPCVTVRGVCGCLWRGGEMPMAAVHACAHRWAWACRRVDACAATGVGRARRGACAGVRTSVPVRCPRCARGCEASPRGSPCCLAHPTLTPQPAAPTAYQAQGPPGAQRSTHGPQRPVPSRPAASSAPHSCSARNPHPTPRPDPGPQTQQ